jgi:hypothetical protein
MAKAPSRFNIVAYTGGKLRVDGFEIPVVVDLKGLEASGAIPIAIKHDTGDATILGQTDDDAIINDGSRLLLGGQVTADPDLSPSAKRIFAMAEKGHKWQASIGAQIEESRDVMPGEVVLVNNQYLEGPFVLASRSTLRETSVLGMGADRHTSVTFAANAVLSLTAAYPLMNADEGFEGWLKKLELSEVALSEEARQALLQQYAVLTRDPNDTFDVKEDDMAAATDDDKKIDEPETVAESLTETPADEKKEDVKAGADLDLTAAASQDIQAFRRLQTAEYRRVSAIKAACKGDDQVIATAIEKGWDVVRAENEFLKRRDLRNVPSGHRTEDEGQRQIQALQGAMLLRAGVALDNKEFSGEMGMAFSLPKWLRAGLNSDQRQQAMEAAWEFREFSLVDFCRAALEAEGKSVPRGRSDMIRAAVSGGQLADIFTTNINALMLQKFIEHPDTTAGWTRESDAMNFQTMERTRLTKGPRLSLHGRGGEADNATRSDVMQSYKIQRFSQQFKVDEMDIIDDRFDAISDVPSEMALAAARVRPDLVYSILLNGTSVTINTATSTTSLFSASQENSQANYVASGAALASGTLQTALATMFNLQENGVGIGATPTHLIVPANLFGTAATLLQSPTIVVSGTSGSVTTSMSQNALLAMQSAWGLINIVSDQRLANGVTDPVSGTAYSGSTSNWYLASNKVPTIEVAYLRGSGRAPQVRQYMLDKGHWGIGWDVNLDIGAKAMAWQGLYLAKA